MSDNPYQREVGADGVRALIWDEGFAAGRAALPDPTVLAPGTWIAPDGSPQDAAEIEAYVRQATAGLPDPPTECDCGMPHLGGTEHADECPAGIAQSLAHLTTPAAALPDERLREADDRKVILEWAKFTRDESAGYWGKREEDVYQRLLAAAAPVTPDTENQRWTIWVCPECGATKGAEAEWRDGKKIVPERASRWCGPTHEHPRRKMRPVEVVAAGRAAAHPDPPDDWTAAILTLRRAMCTPAGREQVERELIRPFAASPDERLREALRVMIDVFDRHDRWCGHYADAPGDGIIHKVPAARAALAADREAPDECRAPHCWYEYGTPCGTCPVAPPVSDEQEKP